MKVSICIPTCNQGQFVALAIHSALNQSWKGELEVWVADDASNDQTPQILRELSLTHPKLKILSRDARLGIVGNIDDLLRRQTADFIVRLDSDDLLKPDYVKRLLQLMIENPTAGVAHSNVEEIDKDGNVVKYRRLRKRPCFQTGSDALRESIKGFRVAANICMFRREALEVCGFMPGRPDERAQDYHLFVKLADSGYGNLHDSEILGSYRVWLTSNQHDSVKKESELQGIVRIFDETLQSAYLSRNWNTAELARARRRLALGNANHLAEAALYYGTSFSCSNHQKVVDLLHKLGSSRRLVAKIWFIKHGFSQYILAIMAIRKFLKDKLKRLIK